MFGIVIGFVAGYLIACFESALAFVTGFGCGIDDSGQLVFLFLQNGNSSFEANIFLLKFIKFLLELESFGVQSLFVLEYFLGHDPGEIIGRQIWLMQFDLLTTGMFG